MPALAVFAAMAWFAIPGARALVVPGVTFDGNGFFHLNSGQSDYVGYAPDSYNPNTPINLFVWMHGCGGDSEGDMYAIAPVDTRAAQSYIAISIGGRDGDCWDTATDSAKVLAAVKDVARYFKINPRKVYIGGYSSGGDLAYRVAFEHTLLFAGILAENTDPFRDTGATRDSLLASATWKIPIAHLAHLSDTTYPIAQVRANLATLKTHGFPVNLIEKAGTHYDPDAGASGTTYDLIHFLLPYLDAGWASPVVPAISLKTPKKVTTRKAVYKVKGSVPEGATVARVEARVGKAKFKKAKGTTNWTFLAHLEEGKNRVTARAVAPGGASSAPVKTTIVRK